MLRQSNAFYKEVNAEIIAQRQEDLDASHQDPVNNAIYDNPNAVNEYVYFIPDPVPDIQTIIEKLETRKAKVIYPFRSEYFSADYTIIYDYYSYSFDIIPKNLKYKIQKKLPFCASAIISSNGYGALIQWKIWRFNLGAGGIVNREIEGVALVTLGFNF